MHYDQLRNLSLFNYKGKIKYLYFTNFYAIWIQGEIKFYNFITIVLFFKMLVFVIL
jgi:hypothetical protein